MWITIDVTGIAADLQTLDASSLNFTPPKGYESKLNATMQSTITAWANQTEVDPYGEWIDAALGAAAHDVGLDWHQMALAATGELYDLLATPEVRALGGAEETTPSVALARYLTEDTRSTVANAIRQAVKQRWDIDPSGPTDELAMPVDPSVAYVRVRELDGHTLIGDAGGFSQVNGAVEESFTVPGTYSVETEHGTLHLDPEELVTVVGDHAVGMTVLGVRSVPAIGMPLHKWREAFREAMLRNMAEVSLLDDEYPLQCR